MLDDLLRWVRLRGLKDGEVQKVRAEALDNKAHDEASRFADYGIKSMPVDGQGLALHVGGHTIILRMDVLGKAPSLAAWEVALWHKDGHHVVLRAGKKVEVMDAAEVVVHASTKVILDTPLVQTKQDLQVGGNLDVAHKTTTAGLAATGAGGQGPVTIAQAVEFTGPSVTHNNMDIGSTHKHDGVAAGSAQSGAVV